MQALSQPHLACAAPPASLGRSRRPCRPLGIAKTPRRRLQAPQAAASSRGGGAGTAGGSVAGRGKGNGVLVLPGFLFSSRHYKGMVADLRSRGFDAEVMPTATSDWFPILTGGSFEWYVERLDPLVQQMSDRTGGRIALLGHSAGGWLARILLGGTPYQGRRYGRSGLVHSLVTLGTPHLSIENYPMGRTQESLSGPEIDAAPPAVRGSSLKFANHFYPDASSLGGVRVVCACGDSIHGRLLWGSSSSSDGSDGSSESNGSNGSGGFGGHIGPVDSYVASSESCDEAGQPNSSGFGALMGRWEAYLAYEGYKSGCGRGDVDGDGVTPLCIAQLPGAEQLILPGVWHIPRKNGQLWYGDSAVLDEYLRFLRAPESSAAGRR